VLLARSSKEGPGATARNAKLVPSNRRLLVARVLEEHVKIADVAAGFGVSERTAYRWLARSRAGCQDEYPPPGGGTPERPEDAPRDIPPEFTPLVDRDSNAVRPGSPDGTRIAHYFRSLPTASPSWVICPRALQRILTCRWRENVSG
jgi:hypothetical protein